MNPWKTLGINRQSSDDTIRAAYIELAKKHHPDHKTGNKDKFVQINEAYQILGDRQRRSTFIRAMLVTNPNCVTCKGEGVMFKRKGFTHGVASSCLSCGGAGVVL